MHRTLRSDGVLSFAMHGRKKRNSQNPNVYKLDVYIHTSVSRKNATILTQLSRVFTELLNIPCTVLSLSRRCSSRHDLFSSSRFRTKNSPRSQKISPTFTNLLIITPWCAPLLKNGFFPVCRFLGFVVPFRGSLICVQYFQFPRSRYRELMASAREILRSR